MMRLRFGIVAATLTLFALALAPVASPASETASVSGYAYVCTADGPLPFARVILASRGEERIVQADREGRFTALGLSPGPYRISLRNVELTVASPGSTSPWDERMKVRVHARVSASRALNLVANDVVSLRIGVGATVTEMHQVSSVQCDPDVVPIKLSPIDRTTVVSQ